MDAETAAPVIVGGGEVEDAKLAMVAAGNPVQISEGGWKKIDEGYLRRRGAPVDAFTLAREAMADWAAPYQRLARAQPSLSNPEHARLQMATLANWFCEGSSGMPRPEVQKFLAALNAGCLPRVAEGRQIDIAAIARALRGEGFLRDQSLGMRRHSGSVLRTHGLLPLDPPPAPRATVVEVEEQEEARPVLVVDVMDQLPARYIPGSVDTFTDMPMALVWALRLTHVGPPGTEFAMTQVAYCHDEVFREVVDDFVPGLLGRGNGVVEGMVAAEEVWAGKHGVAHAAARVPAALSKERLELVLLGANLRGAALPLFVEIESEEVVRQTAEVFAWSTLPQVLAHACSDIDVHIQIAVKGVRQAIEDMLAYRGGVLDAEDEFKQLSEDEDEGDDEEDSEDDIADEGLSVEQRARKRVVKPLCVKLATQAAARARERVAARDRLMEFMGNICSSLCAMSDVLCLPIDPGTYIRLSELAATLIDVRAFQDATARSMQSFNDKFRRATTDRSVALEAIKARREWGKAKDRITTLRWYLAEYEIELQEGVWIHRYLL